MTIQDPPNPPKPAKDAVFRDPQQIVDFVFDDTVAGVFPDMIRRSVPGYETVIPITGLMAARHVPEGGSVFDLGCSLGATTLATLRQLGEKRAQVIAVDNAPAMLERARELIDDDRVRFVCEDLTATDLTGANVVLMNYVLQFLSPELREATLSRMREQMHPEGLLIISEKIGDPDQDLHTFYDDTHLAWKRANGYSELEVSQKRAALENVMIIDTETAHRERFARAGFTQVDTWFRCLNWASFLVRP